MTKIKKYLPGIILTLIIYILANIVDFGMDKLLNFTLGVLTLGILLGIIINNISTIDDKFRPGIKFSLKKLLKIGIILLGFEINFLNLINLGPKILMMVIFYVPIVIIISYFLGKIFGLNKRVSTLIGVGTAICGNSAIVAISPIIDSKESDSVLSISVISFIGAIGVLIYPLIANVFSLKYLQYGVWSGMSLHGVAHALAAAFMKGSKSLKIATFVKMSRVVMLVPVSIILASLNKNENNNRAKFPMYVVYFVIVGFINTFVNVPEILTGNLKELSSIFITMAMISMGLSVDFKNIKDKGIKVVALGITLFIIVSTLSYLVIQFVT